MTLYVQCDGASWSRRVAGMIDPSAAMRVDEILQDARNRGARVIQTGGIDGNVLQPAIVTSRVDGDDHNRGHANGHFNRQPSNV